MKTFLHRLARGATALMAVSGLAACDNILEVEFPGQIPTEQIGDPSLAAVLTRSAVGDFECAYSNYMSGSAVHSDEYETANSNVPLANWGERTISPDETDYSIGTCEGNFGMNLTLHTARLQAEDATKKLGAWTDAQVAGRASLQAQAKVYAAYSYLLMGEGFCEVAFDGAARQPPTAALTAAESRFAEGITLAQASGNTDMLNLARVGMARTKMDLKKWAEAATFAAAVADGYTKNVDRGQETTRRHNKLWRLAEQTGAYTVATAYRSIADPRVLVADAGRGSFNAEVRLWVTKKYTGLTSPMRLASKIEANLIQAEALAQQGQVGPAMTIINARRAAVNLPALTATTQAEAVAHVIEERRKELSFEGGHRLNDLLRYNIVWKTGSNPFTNRPYGSTRCWPHPTREINGV
ncbi:MAG: RagB/SusD family nutrient uptake outer membrane protein [Gemmatimonadetes bacterium]|nr:RagB/SusD family nutrient uptake outer membrane protein [Gemmatimonadota bacterium]